MEQITHEISSQKSSLLILNDDCISEVFKYLQFKDYLNLAATCSRLLCVAQENKKYKNIKVVTCDYFWSDSSTQKFYNIFEVIGKHVASVFVEINHEAIIMETIADYCTNINSVELTFDKQIRSKFFAYSGGLPFRNLKELKVGKRINLSIDDWKNCFANNPEIESLQFNNLYMDEFMPLLKMLPKLKSLTIDNMLKVTRNKGNYLSCLASLTKLSFQCADYDDDEDYNRLLIDLAAKLKLVELDFAIQCNTTFAVLKSFQHLEILSVRNPYGWDYSRVPENIIFPSMLKQIKFDGFDMSCNIVLSIVKQLKFLEILGIGYGNIFWDDDDSEYIPNRRCPLSDINRSKIILWIAEKLQVENRKLQIIFTNYVDLKDKQVFKYSDNLEIIMNPRNARKRSFDHIIDLWT